MFQVCAGLDLSLRNAGVAVITAPNQAFYNSFGYGISAKSSERDSLERVIYIANQIMGFLGRFDVKRIGVENYGFATKGKIAMQGELSGVVKTQLLMTGRMPIVVGTNMVRKFLLGRAVKDKEVVKEHLVALGYPPPNNLDESDALAVAHLAHSWANCRHGEVSEYRIGVFKSIDYNLVRTRV